MSNPDSPNFYPNCPSKGKSVDTLVPLDQFQITSTNDVEEAEAILSRSLSELRIKDVRNRKQFSLNMNGISFGKTQLFFNEFASYTSIDPGQPEESIVLTIAYNNPSVVHIDQKPFICKDNSAVIVSPAKKIMIERPANSGFILLRSTRNAISQRYRELTGREPATEIIFENSVDLSNNAWAPLHRTIGFLIKTLHDIPNFVDNPLFRKDFDDLLLDGLLSLPNNHYEHLNQPPHTATPDIVCRAEEFMDANACEPISISDIVNACNCSRSSLFEAFHQYREYSPVQFLTNKRLDRARAQLLRPNPHDTVTSIAYHCGLFHLGRFSIAYRKRFGESPSKTLKSNR